MHKKEIQKKFHTIIKAGSPKNYCLLNLFSKNKIFCIIPLLKRGERQ